MRTAIEVQEFLDKNPITDSDLQSVANWLGLTYTCGWVFKHLEVGGVLLPDVIEFVNSPSPSKEKDLSPIVAQFAKVKKEVDKLEKLISRL